VEAATSKKAVLPLLVTNQWKSVQLTPVWLVMDSSAMMTRLMPGAVWVKLILMDASGAAGPGRKSLEIYSKRKPWPRFTWSTTMSPWALS